jgi:excisionase family DNA binding protein
MTVTETASVGRDATKTVLLPAWLTAGQVATHASVSVRHVRRATASGNLPSTGEGRTRRYARAEVDEWVRRGARAGAA